MKHTFSSGYTVFLQAAHFSNVPENMVDTLLGVLFCACQQTYYNSHKSNFLNKKNMSPPPLFL